MAKKVQDEENAFPLEERDMSQVREIHAIHHGMSLRDYFAAKALQGILANSFSDIEFAIPDYAQTAYLLADAMMRERKKCRET